MTVNDAHCFCGLVFAMLPSFFRSVSVSMYSDLALPCARQDGIVYSSAGQLAIRKSSEWELHLGDELLLGLAAVADRNLRGSSTR